MEADWSKMISLMCALERPRHSTNTYEKMQIILPFLPRWCSITASTIRLQAQVKEIEELTSRKQKPGVFVSRLIYSLNKVERFKEDLLVRDVVLKTRE